MSQLARKHALLVTHDRTLRTGRLAALVHKGYTLDLASSDGEAISMVRSGRYDLILIGRDADTSVAPLSEGLAGAGQQAPVLQIDAQHSVYAHVIGTEPEKTLAELQQLFNTP